MATEYYIVKPDKKEMYCLGKRLYYFSYIKDESYGKEADYDAYECFQDFVLDLIENNPNFMESVWEDTWGTINELFHEIWEFIEGDKVLLVADVSDYFTECSDYKDAGSIYDFFERRANATEDSM